MLEWLRERADSNWILGHAYEGASGKGQMHVLKWLIKRDTRRQLSVVWAASFKGNIEVVSYKYTISNNISSPGSKRKDGVSTRSPVVSRLAVANCLRCNG